MLEEGRGSPPNPAQALELYRASAGQNFLPAQQNLGIILADSGGGDAALAEAYVWLALAVENGAKPTGRDIVAQKLAPAQLAEANLTLVKKKAQLGLTDRPAAAEPITAAPIPPAAPVPVVPAPNPVAPVDRNPANDGENDRLKREIARLAAVAEAAAQERKQLEQKLVASERSLATAISKAAAAEEQAKVANATRRTDDGEREKLAQQLARAQAALDEARLKAEAATAESARLQAAQPPEAAPPPREYSALLAQLERLTREAATLRTEKADLTRRLSELTDQLPASRSSPVAAAGPAVRDTRFVPLQELAATDRRIAKLIADNTRLQEHVKKSVAELTELSRQLVTPEPRPDSAATRGAATAPAAR